MAKNKNPAPKSASNEDTDWMKNDPTTVEAPKKADKKAKPGKSAVPAKVAKAEKAEKAPKGDAEKGRPAKWAGKKLKSTDYECREGTIRSKFKSVFAKGMDVEKGLAAVLDGFEAPRSALFKSDPEGFVRGHVSTYIKRGWLVEV